MTDTAQAYPLQWPVATPRTQPSARAASKFSSSRGWNYQVDAIRHELDLLGATAITISTNQPVRKDGNPYAQVRLIDDPGVAVYFRLDGKPVCLPCDRWLTIAENLRAITLHIEAMRGMNRWGVGRANQVFDGYKALPASTEDNWWDVLGCKQHESTIEIRDRYRALVKVHHPDAPGGSEAAMTRLNLAFDRAMAERGVHA